MERGGRAQGGVEREDHYPAWRVAKETPAACARACVYVKERHQPCVCVSVCVCLCVCGRPQAAEPGLAPSPFLVLFIREGSRGCSHLLHQAQSQSRGSMGATSPGPMALEVGTHSSLLLLIWGAGPLLPLTEHRAADGTRHGQRDAPVHTFWSRLQALTPSAEREQPGPASPWQLDHGPSLASRLPGPQTSVLTKITLSSSPVGTRIPESTRRPGRSLGVR